jgi:HK97 family phage major capsid protein
MPSIGELEDKKSDVQNQLKVLNKEKQDKGKWTDEQLTTVTNLAAEYTKIQTELTRERDELKRQADIASSLQSIIGDEKKSPSGAALGNPQGDDGASLGKLSDNFMALMQHYGSDLPNFVKAQENATPTFRCGAPGQYAPMDSDTIQHDGKMISIKTLSSPIYRKAWRDTIKNIQGESQFVQRLSQVKAECFDTGCGTVMSPSDFASGGFMLNPMTFASELQKCCDKTVVMRSISNVVTVTSIGISIPRLRKRLASFAKGCECEPPVKCDVPEGDRIEFRPQPWTQCTGICDALLKFTSMPVERLLMDELTRDLRENLEFLYLYDDGMSGPLGILHPNGLLTPDLEITTATFAGSVALNFLIDAMCALPNCASNRAEWLFSNLAWCDILKLVDGNDRHYFAEIINAQGVGQGVSRPNLMGHPVNISETITGDFTIEDDYPGVFGDFSSYLILDGPATDLKKDTNIFSNRTCWVARGYTGGGVVNDCDFIRLKVIAAE